MIIESTSLNGVSEMKLSMIDLILILIWMSTKPKLNVPVHIKQRQAFWTGLVISTRIITDIQRRKDIVKLTLINMT